MSGLKFDVAIFILWVTVTNYPPPMTSLCSCLTWKLLFTGDRDWKMPGGAAREISYLDNSQLVTVNEQYGEEKERERGYIFT